MTKYLLFLLCTFLLLCFSCETPNCDKKGELAKRGLSYNKLRLQIGAPIIHDYMCFDRGTNKMEGWDAPIQFQLSAQKGFHAGKGIFLQSELDLDEKDIYRHRIDDSTFEFLGILTELSADVVTFPSVWYGFIDQKSLKGEPSERKFAEVKYPLTIDQADSILSKWGTGRK